MRPIDPRIKLRHLVCFWEVARLRSVVQAAEQMNISQPAVSKTLKDLEDLIGEPLFDRSKRRLTLTAAGEVFFSYAATAISALRLGLDAAKGTPAGDALRIGALPTVSAHILPETLKRLTQSDPHLRSQIVSGPNEYLLSQLRAGGLDVVIGRMASAEEMRSLSFEHLYSEQVVFAVRPDHPLLHSAEFSLAAISAYQIIKPDPNSVIRKVVDRLLLTHGVSDLHGTIETVSTAFSRAYVRETEAIWIISRGAVAADLAEGQLAILPVDSSDTLGPVGLTMRTDMLQSLGLRSFTAHLRAVAALSR